MPSNLLKSSPVDTSPPVVILPPHIVEIEVDGVTEQLDVHCELECIDKEEYDAKYTNNQHATKDGDRYLDQDLKTPGSSQEASGSSITTTGKTGRRGKSSNRSLKKLQNSQQQDGTKNGETPKPSTSSRKSLKHQQSKDEKKLPEAVVRVLENYQLDDAPPRPNNAYIRYIERTSEELAEIVEYDLDEEDLAWLALVNAERAKDSLQPITPNCMEEIMDKLEKESFYQSSVMDQGSLIDDDAVCCICMDGECQNANAILFCDMCNLAVHQECYGVPYIPEGQWLCRRCFFSPSRPVECVLCPNAGGAFKQTECKRWAHVVCAIWIPEVCFANTVFLEPIDNINTIPPARWRLTCFICKQKNRGACIQCIKNNCYTAFHVTCAQQAGLCMRMDPDSERGVKKKAWCPAHAPADFIADRETDSSTEHQRLKHVRKMLAEKRCAPPMVLLPTISADKIAQISSRYNFRRKDSFMARVMAYWKLKRSSRNGVPLLRRLQITNTSAACKSSRKGDVPEAEHCKQNYADTLRVRQDLEKGRLLCELTRKREKTKRELIYVRCQEWDMRIQPYNYFLSSIIDDLVMKDTQSIFTQPVDPELVPDYLTVIKKPMDLSTMRKNIFEYEYETIDDLQADFELMINNCMQYNSKDTLFYRAASRMQELGGIVFREAKRTQDRVGFLPGGVMSETPPSQYHDQPEIVDDATLSEEIEQVLEDKERHGLSFEDHLRVLQEILDKSLNMLNLNARKKKFIRIKKEIYRLKKKQRLDDEGEEESVGGARDVSSMDEDEMAPSLFGGDTVESSDIGEDGGESGASSSRYSNIRRRLRSTDHNELQPPRHQQQIQSPQTSAGKSLLNSPRLSRRLSRSSESVGSVLTPLASSVSSSATASGVNVRPAVAPSVSSSVSSRPRGRPPKFLSQQQRGRGRGPSKVRASGQSGSISPLRQSTNTSSPSRARRGGIRGRPSKLRRNLRRPLRRSARVDNLQKQAQVQQHSNSSPEKDFSGSSRHASPGGRSISPPKSSRSSRNVSPTLASTPKSQHSRGSGVQNRQSPAPSSSGKSILTTKGRPINRAPSPILGSPLKPGQEWIVEAVFKRKHELHQRSLQAALNNPSHQRVATAPSPSIDTEVRPRGRGRPPRKSVAKVVNNNINNSSSAVGGNSSRTDSGSSKSMEAAAKSVICEDRLSSARSGRQLHHSANKTSRRRILVDSFDDEGREGEQEVVTSPNRLGAGAGAISPTARRNSNARGSALLQNLKAARHSSTGNTSPTRKLKGPAGAVGRRRKSTNSDVNGPLLYSPTCGRNETSERKKAGGGPLNGISPRAMSPVRHPVSSLHNHPTGVKKRPRRSAAVNAAKSIHGANVNVAHHNNNSLISGSGSGSLHHHHHHHHPHHSPRKNDSFSVYRSGGDHDINSYSEAEDELSEDEVEEEEDDEEEEDEEEEEEEEEDDDDEDEEEEEEEGVCSTLQQEEDESDDDDEDENRDDSEDSSGDEGQVEKQDAGDAEEPDEEEDAEGQDEDEDVVEPDEELEELNEETEEQSDNVVNEGVRQNDSSPSENSSDSDDESDSSSTSSSTLSSTSAASNRSKESSSSSITTPKHLYPTAKRMKVVRRRRSSSKQQRPLPAILTKLSSSSPSPRSRPIIARSNQNCSPDITHLVSHNNNNNVLYNNKEKDRRERDNVSTSSSDGVSGSVGSPVNRRDSVTAALD